MNKPLTEEQEQWNRETRREYRNQWYIDNGEYFKQYRAENRERRRAYDKQWREQNSEYFKQYHANRTPEQKTRDRERARKYSKQRYANRTPEQKTRDRERARKYRKQRRQNDLEFKIACYVRNRLYGAIKNGYKSGSAIRDLGCTIPEFKQYIESKWLPGMTWGNYSKHGWHIDHIIPLASFNLLDEDQCKVACHYTNLQPLWAKDNISKNAKTSTYNKFFYEPIENNSL